MRRGSRAEPRGPAMRAPPHATGSTLPAVLCACAILLHAGGVSGSGHVVNPLSRGERCSSDDNTNCGDIASEPFSLEGPDGWPAAGPADGSIASAGVARFSQLDEQTETRWSSTSLQPGPFVFTWFLQNPVPTQSWSYYITEEGWDRNSPLSRASFGGTPFCEADAGGNTPGDVVVDNDCTIPERTGYHVVLAVWDIDGPTAFYNVIDVNIGSAPPTGGGIVSAGGQLIVPASRVELCAFDDNKNCGDVAREPSKVEGPDGWPAAGPPDGQIASAGTTRFGELDVQAGDRWFKIRINPGDNTFTWFFENPAASVGFKYYISKDGWDPESPLTRDSFESTPFCEVDSGGAVPDSVVDHTCVVPERQSGGYHVLLAVWDVADVDTSIYNVVDVTMPAGAVPPPTFQAKGHVVGPMSRSEICAVGDNVGCGEVAFFPGLVEGPDGFPGADGPPDGSIASGGNPRFASLDEQNEDRWQKVELAPGAVNFAWFLETSTVTASFKYYMTVDGWDPSAPLSRAAFDTTPFCDVDGRMETPEQVAEHACTVPERTPGYHVVLSVWDLGETENSIYSVIDVTVTAPPAPAPPTGAPGTPSPLQSGVGHVVSPPSRGELCAVSDNTDCGDAVTQAGFLEGPDGWPTAGPADGSIASAGVARFGQLDEQTETRWTQLGVPPGETVFVWFFQTPVTTVGFEYYITKDGWNPNAALSRNSFDLTPFCEVDGMMETPPVTVEHTCTIPDRTGYHVILALWDVDGPTTFYNVIDIKPPVQETGAPNTPAPDTQSPPIPPTVAPPTEAPPTPVPAGGPPSGAVGHVIAPPSRAELCAVADNTNCDNAANQPGLLEGPDGWPTAGPEDGSIASAGVDRFSQLDEQTESRWSALDGIPGSSTFVWFFETPVTTVGFKYYITKDGWNPNAALSRNSFDLTPFCEVDGRMETPPVTAEHTCTIPDRTGYHVILALWDVDGPTTFYNIIDMKLPVPVPETDAPDTAAPSTDTQAPAAATAAPPTTPAVTAEGHMVAPPSRAELCAVSDNTDCGVVSFEPHALAGPSGFPAGGPVDGSIASAGLALYSELNEQTETRWFATDTLPGTRQFTWFFRTPEPTVGFKYFMTKDGWNPNAALSRDSFDLTPFCEVDGKMETPNMVVDHTCDLPARTGYHVVLGVWDVSGAFSFYNVLDLNVKPMPPPTAVPDTPAPDTPAPTPAPQIDARGHVVSPPSRGELCSGGDNANCGDAVSEPGDIEGPDGWPTAGPADANIASAMDTRFDPLDEQTASRWFSVAAVPGEKTFTWLIQTPAPTVDFKYYMTKVGWDPNAALSRDSFELTPFCEVDGGMGLPEVLVEHTCTVPAQTGYHVVLAVWDFEGPNSMYNVLDLKLPDTVPTPAPQAPPSGYVIAPPSRVELCSVGENKNCPAVQGKQGSLQGPDGWPAAGPADGSIASAGVAEYSALDEAGEARWFALSVLPGENTLTWFIQSPAPTKDFRYYLTKDGWDTSAALARDSFDPTPFCVVDGKMETPDLVVDHTCNLPQRSGYHVILAVWDVGGDGQSFYNVLDVNMTSPFPATPAPPTAVPETPSPQAPVGHVVSPPSRGELCAASDNINCGDAATQAGFLEGPDGWPTAGPADGSIASAGVARFSQLDEQTESRWNAIDVIPGPTTLVWFFQTPVTTVGFEYYITKDGWNPNAALSRNSFDLTPFCEVDGMMETPPVTVEHTCTIPDRTGYHVILALWDVDGPTTFYNVIDIKLPLPETDAPTTPAPDTPTPLTPPTVAPPTPTPPTPVPTASPRSPAPPVSTSAEGQVAVPPSRASLCASQQNANCGDVMYEPFALEGPDAWPADGSIASAGVQRFAPLNQQSADRWVASPLSPGQRTFAWFFRAPRSTKSFSYYITQRGWDANRQLGRGSFDASPFCSVDGGMRAPSSREEHTCTVPQRAGYHVILAVWDIGDTATSFFNVIDVEFPAAPPTQSPPGPPLETAAPGAPATRLPPTPAPATPAPTAAPCAFASIHTVPGATPSGVGCFPGGTVVHRASCVYSHAGHVCGAIICSDGMWDTISMWESGGAFPRCTPRACPFDQLRRPSDASATGAGCRFGGTVPSGETCAFTKDGHDCEEATCTEGQWNRHDVGCGALSCSFNTLQVPAGATPFGRGCQAGGSVASDPLYGCMFVREGHDCEHSVCTQGVWDNEVPKCTPKMCNAGDLTRPSHAIPHNCSLGLVAAGTTCGFMSLNRGWSCGTATCANGVWTDSVRCAAASCPFDSLRSGSLGHALENHTFAGAGCAAGGAVPSGGSCLVRLAGHTCQSLVCSEGLWDSGGTTACAPDTCDFDTIRVVEEGSSAGLASTPSGAGCARGGAVPHLGSCFFKAEGHTCPHAQCAGGAWQPRVVACKADAVKAAPEAGTPSPEDDGVPLWLILAIIAGQCLLLVGCLALLAWCLFRPAGGKKKKAGANSSESESAGEGEAADPEAGADHQMTPVSLPQKAASRGGSDGGGDPLAASLLQDDCGASAASSPKSGSGYARSGRSSLPLVGRLGLGGAASGGGAGDGSEPLLALESAPALFESEGLEEEEEVHFSPATTRGSPRSADAPSMRGVLADMQQQNPRLTDLATPVLAPHGATGGVVGVSVLGARMPGGGAQLASSQRGQRSHLSSPRHGSPGRAVAGGGGYLTQQTHAHSGFSPQVAPAAQLPPMPPSPFGRFFT